MAKRLTNSQLLGQQGMDLVSTRVHEMGFAWHPTNASLDAGIDGYIELRDPSTGEAKNAILLVQSKARSALERETDESFEFTCTPEDLSYWLQGTAPVLLVVSKPKEQRAWWVSVKDYFRSPDANKSRRVRFIKRDQAFDKSATTSLIALAATSGSGAYFPPIPRQEKLLSNLLAVTRSPARIYWAQTQYTDRNEVWDELKKHVEWPDREWFLYEQKIYSIHDLHDDPWAKVCDIGTIETADGREWSRSRDREIQRMFVRFLNECLRSRVGPMGLRFTSASECFYFKATKELTTRRKSYRSLRVKTSRDVFKAYPSKSDPTRIAYYRHVGFERRFRNYDGKWFLEINPTYVFTSDGHELHPFREELLSKIKTIEGNAAVLGLVVMFADLLHDEEGLFARAYPHLGFGWLESVELPVGIDDKAWLNRDELKLPESDEEDFTQTLFDR